MRWCDADGNFFPTPTESERVEKINEIAEAEAERAEKLAAAAITEAEFERSEKVAAIAQVQHQQTQAIVKLLSIGLPPEIALALGVERAIVQAMVSS